MTDPPTGYDRDELAAWYAAQHLKVDPGLEAVAYFPEGAGERSIRFVAVNREIAGRTDEALEPIIFPLEMGTTTEHRLEFFDVSPEQWERLEAGTLDLPEGWSRAGRRIYRPERVAAKAAA